MSDTILELEHIEKHFGDTGVLHGVSLSVQHGEFVTLLGPSGCGKTTTLRIIAGLETPDAGRVVLRGKDVTAAPPEKRDVNTVFQNYALFPHMSVAANISYSLRLKKMPRAEIAKEVDAALELVQLSGYGARMPAELSGGQRQRVAIARAIVNFEQVGTPAEVYDRPRTSFVARFVGTANIVKGQVAENREGVLTVRAAGGQVPALCCGCGKKAGDNVTLAVRSEHVEFCTEGGIPATVKEKTFAGGMLRIALALENGDELVASRHGIDIALSAGDGVRVCWAAQNAVPVDTHTEAQA